jgi:hypothetical protein
LLHSTLGAQSPQDWRVDPTLPLQYNKKTRKEIILEQFSAMKPLGDDDDHAIRDGPGEWMRLGCWRWSASPSKRRRNLVVCNRRWSAELRSYRITTLQHLQITPEALL